jgi:hypothetical protein
MLIQCASGSGRGYQWQYGCIKGGKVSFRSIIRGKARRACMTKVALCWATGSDMGKWVRNPASVGAESMFPEADKKSGVVRVCQVPISSAQFSAGVGGREVCTALEKRRLFSSVASRVPGGSSPGTARRSVRSAIGASCSNSNALGGATPSSVGERGQVGSRGEVLRVGGFILCSTYGRS